MSTVTQPHTTWPVQRRSPLVAPPQVTVPQWLIVFSQLLVAAVGMLAPSETTLFVVITALSISQCVLVFLCILTALNHKTLGIFLLPAATASYFYLEAATAEFSGVGFTPRFPRLSLGEFSPSIILLSLLCVGLFQLALFIGYSVRPRIEPLVKFARSRCDHIDGVWWRLRYLLALAAFIPYLIVFGLNPVRLFTTLAAARTGNYVSQVLDNAGPFVHLRTAALYLIGLLLAEALLSKRGGSRFVSLSVAAVALLIPISEGTRHILLFATMPVVSIALIRSHSIQHAIRWATLSVIFVSLSQLQLAVRNVGWSAPMNRQALESTMPFEQFQMIPTAITVVPALHPFFYETTLGEFARYWIPRSLWANKPPYGESTAWINDLVLGFRRYGSVTPSVIGQFYLNWGVPGVFIIGLWLGFLTYIVDGLSAAVRGSQFAFAGCLGSFYASLICMFRYYAPYYLSFSVFAFILMLLITTGRRRAR